MAKTLVAYFSASRTTANVARDLAEAVGADLLDEERRKPVRRGARAIRVLRRPFGEDLAHVRGDARPDDGGELESIRKALDNRLDGSVVVRGCCTGNDV